MLELKAQDRLTKAPAAPELMLPGTGTAVDAPALTFEWAESDADSYVLEVARDPGFTEVLCLVPTGNSTSVTIFDLFRPDGSTYYWRVEAQLATGARATSEIRSFVAASYERAARIAPKKVERSERVRYSSEPEQAWEEIRPPYRTGTTTRGEMIAAFAITVVSFLLMVAYLFHLSSQI